LFVGCAAYARSFGEEDEIEYIYWLFASFFEKVEKISSRIAEDVTEKSLTAAAVSGLDYCIDHPVNVSCWWLCNLSSFLVVV